MLQSHSLNTNNQSDVRIQLDWPIRGLAASVVSDMRLSLIFGSYFSESRVGSSLDSRLRSQPHNHSLFYDPETQSPPFCVLSNLIVGLFTESCIIQILYQQSKKNINSKKLYLLLCHSSRPDVSLSAEDLKKDKGIYFIQLMTENLIESGIFGAGDLC